MNRDESQPGIEDLFDRYLDACLRGDDIEEPRAFAARYGITDRVVLDRLEALRIAARGRVRARQRRAAQDLPFDRLGEFRLIRRLGAGGMGTVYEAVQESLGRRVALKVIRAELATSPGIAERFEREALAIAKLGHPNIVEVYALGEDDGVRYMAMELLTGESLEVRLQSSAAAPLPVNQLLTWTATLARALHHAHQHGVVHRDVKPSNIHIAPDDRVLLLDFGIARDTQTVQGTLTRTFAGSPLYAAPEQVMGQPIDGRADVYGLGITLYRALTGRVPFEGGALDQVIARALTEIALAPRKLNASIPRDLETVVLKAIEKEPGRRYASAAQFADDLDAVLENRPTLARPPGRVRRVAQWAQRRPALATGLVASVLVVAGALLYFESERRDERDRRAQQAVQKMAEALQRIEAYAAQRERTGVERVELKRLQQAMESVGFTRENERRLDALEERYTDHQRQRDTAYHEVLELIRAAQEWDPAVAGVEAAKAAIHFERYREALTARDRTGQEYYEALVNRHDRTGQFARTVAKPEWTRVRVEPADAALYLFRFARHADVAEGGSQRLVPVPFRDGAAAISYGARCLRVVSPVGDLEHGDLIVSLQGQAVDERMLVARGRAPVQRLDRLLRVGDVDLPSPLDVSERTEDVEIEFERGARRYVVKSKSLATLGVTLMTAAECASAGNVTARVLRDETWHDIELPAGAVVRPTAQPLLGWRHARMDGTAWDVPKGAYLLVARRDGYEDLRYTFTGGSSQTTPLLQMVRRGATPRNFVHVPARDNLPAFQIMEREVNCGDYLEFLQDAATRARLARATEPELVPRDGSNRNAGGYWSYDPAQPVAIAAPWTKAWPILGVSWRDAKAYAAWATQRARLRGERATFDLPTRQEWMVAAASGFGWEYAWGRTFRPRWCNGCRSRSHAFPEPSFRYAVDESAYGVFDATGNASEWLADFEDETRGIRVLAGGNWGTSSPASFHLFGAGFGETRVVGSFGFRLVRRP